MKKNVVLFMGEDDYRLRKELGVWKRVFEEKYGELNLSSVDGEKVSGQEVWQAIDTLPLFGGKRMVVVEGLPVGGGARKSEALDQKEAFLAEKVTEVPNETVVVWVSPTPDKRKKFFKALSKVADVKEFKKLKGGELVGWVKKELDRREMRYEMRVPGRMTELVGDDLWVMEREIEKAGLYAGGNELKVVDLEKLIKPQLQENIFALTDAMGTRDVKKMVGHFQTLVEGGEGVQQIFYMLVRQVRLLVSVKSAVEEGEKNVASVLGLHPYVAQTLVKQVGKFEWGELRRMYDELLEIDLELKTSVIEVSAEDTRALELRLERFLVGVGKNK